MGHISYMPCSVFILRTLADVAFFGSVGPKVEDSSSVDARFDGSRFVGRQV